MRLGLFAPTAALAVALSTAGPAPARADEPPSATVVVLPTSAAADADEVERLWGARLAIRQANGLALVDVAGLLGAGDGRAADIDGARGALAEGLAAFDELDVERATPALVDAAAVLSLFPEARAEAVEALTALARVAGAQRDADGAADALALVLRLRPDFALEPGAPPSMAQALAAARAQQAAPPGRLRIGTRPVAAAVFVDGRFVGASPTLIEGLPAGPHLVVLDADGYRRAQRVVDVPPGEGVALDLELAVARKGPLLAEIGAGLLDQVEADQVSAPLRDVRSLFLADQAVLLSERAGAWEAHLYDLKAGRRVRRVGLPPDRAPAQAAAEAVWTLYRGLDPQRPGLAAPEVEPAPGVAGAPYYQTWWFWTGVAVGVAAAITVPVVLLAEEPNGLDSRRGEGSVVLRF